MNNNVLLYLFRLNWISIKFKMKCEFRRIPVICRLLLVCSTNAMKSNVIYLYATVHFIPIISITLAFRCNVAKLNMIEIKQKFFFSKTKTAEICACIYIIVYAFVLKVSESAIASSIIIMMIVGKNLPFPTLVRSKASARN